MFFNKTTHAAYATSKFRKFHICMIFIIEMSESNKNICNLPNLNWYTGTKRIFLIISAFVWSVRNLYIFNIILCQIAFYLFM